MIKRKLLIIVLVIMGVCSGYFIFKHRTNFLLYHSLRAAVIGDRTKEYAFTKEDLRGFPDTSGTKSFGIKWCFKPEAQLLLEPDDVYTYYPEPIVDDIEGDGEPEVYIASYTKKVYCLDGISGKILWDYRLPLGITAGVSTQLIDINGDDRKELIFGTHAPLPIRIYCIKTDKNISNRLIWYRNVHGDFLEGGLASFTTAKGKPRIVYGTRSAPYIEGSLGVIDGKGRIINKPTYGVDICMARPTIYTSRNGKNYAIAGSHGWAEKFYGKKLPKKKMEKYAKSIFSKNIENGKVVWSTYLGIDTGYIISPVVDLDNDGEVDSIIVVSKEKNRSYIFDPETGKAIGFLPYLYKAHFTDENGEVLFLGIDWSGGIKSDLICFSRYNTKVRYRIKGYFESLRYLLDIDNDGVPEFLNEECEKDKFKITVYNALTGKVKYLLRWDIGLDVLKEPLQRSYAHHVLADCDGDGYWEYITFINGYVVCFDTQFFINKKYLRYNRMPYGNKRGTGYDFI